MTFTASEFEAQRVRAAAHSRSIDAQAARERVRAVAMSLAGGRVAATHPSDVPGCACSFDARRAGVHDGVTWGAIGDTVDSSRAFRAPAAGGGALYVDGLAQFDNTNDRTMLSTVTGDALLGAGDFFVAIVGAMRAIGSTFLVADTEENFQIGIDSNDQVFCRVGVTTLYAGHMDNIDDVPTMFEVELLGDVLTFRAGPLGVTSTSGATHEPIGQLSLGFDQNSSAMCEGVFVQLAGFAYVPDRATLRAMRAEAISLIGTAGIAEW